MTPDRKTTPLLRRLSVLLLGALVSTSALASVGNAIPTGPEFYPEFFGAGPMFPPGTSFEYTNVVCAGGGTGTFSFEADGQVGATTPSPPPSTPPYPGTFVETGTVTMVSGVVTSVHADFTIYDASGVVTVTGTKDLITGLPDNLGACDLGAPEDGRLATHAHLTYAATTPDGPSTGCATVNIDNIPDGIFGPGSNPGATGTMTQHFDPNSTCRTVPDPPNPGAAQLTLSPPSAANPVGTQHTVTATARDATLQPAAGVTVLFAVTGANSANGSSVTNPSGQATFTYTGANEGFDNITAVADNNNNGSPDPGEPNAQASKLWFTGTGAGSFVIGDQGIGPGTPAYFWGAKWAKNNGLSGGSAPSSFKGFASNGAPTCSSNWSTGPGNSSNPPATVGQFIPVIVTSSAQKAGSSISGNTRAVVVVQTDPGYAPNPGHEGTGHVVGLVCLGS